MTIRAITAATILILSSTAQANSVQCYSLGNSVNCNSYSNHIPQPVIQRPQVIYQAPPLQYRNNADAFMQGWMRGQAQREQAQREARENQYRRPW